MSLKAFKNSRVRSFVLHCNENVSKADFEKMNKFNSGVAEDDDFEKNSK